MKKIYLGLFSIALLPLWVSTQVYNRGARICMAEGLVIRSGLDLINDEGGWWRNDGILWTNGSLYNRPGASFSGGGWYRISVDWRDEGLFFPASSRIQLAGPQDSKIYSASGEIFDLELAKTDGAVALLESRLRVAGNLYFNSPENHFWLGDHDLIMAEHSAIGGYNPQNYVVTNGQGRVTLPADPSFTIPLGFDEETYNPLAIKGTAACLQVRCLEHAMTDGYAGTILQHAVDAAWEITSETGEAIGFDLTLFWSASDEGMDFDRSQSGIAGYTASGWYLPATRLGPAAVDGQYAREWQNITDLGLFTVADFFWVGLDEILPGIVLNVYPNPSAEGVWIELTPDFSGILRLTDSNGRVLLQKEVADQRFYLTFPAGMPAGVCYLYLRDGLGRTAWKKLVVANRRG